MNNEQITKLWDAIVFVEFEFEGCTPSLAEAEVEIDGEERFLTYEELKAINAECSDEIKIWASEKFN